MPETPRHYFKELRLQQFRSLVALARWKTFSAAASALKITRASVWQQVRALEQEFACALLRTRGQRVELTPAGHKLMEIAAPPVAGFDSVKAGFGAAIRQGSAAHPRHRRGAQLPRVGAAAAHRAHPR